MRQSLALVQLRRQPVLALGGSQRPLRRFVGSGGGGGVDGLAPPWGGTESSLSGEAYTEESRGSQPPAQAAPSTASDEAPFKLYSERSVFDSMKGGMAFTASADNRTFSSVSPLSYDPAYLVWSSSGRASSNMAASAAAAAAVVASPLSIQGSGPAGLSAPAESAQLQQQQSSAGVAAAAFSAAAAQQPQQQQQQIGIVQMGGEKKAVDVPAPAAPVPPVTLTPPAAKRDAKPSLRFVCRTEGLEPSGTADTVGVVGTPLSVAQASEPPQLDMVGVAPAAAAVGEEPQDAEEGVRRPPACDPVGSQVTVRDEMRNFVSAQPLRSFSDIAEDLPPWLNQALVRSGYKAPTLVQSYAIPLFMEQRDVVGIAPTGSGKTVAFAVPALAGLAPPSASGTARSGVERGCAAPQVLVLCPTRELVQQTRSVFATLSFGAVPVCAVFGGSDRDKQIVQLSYGCDVLIAAPGRLCDFIESGVVSLASVTFVVLDEADRMLELGFAAQLEFIMSHLRRNGKVRQTTMWSATWSATVGSLASRFLRPQRLLVEVNSSQKTNVDIQQCLYPLSDTSERIAALVKLYGSGVVQKRQQVLIFCNLKETVDDLVREFITAMNAPPAMVQGLHGGMRQRKREQIIQHFREGHVRVLVATDVAARGLDVPELDHVVNYDLPATTDTYVHRIGRTGRAGRRGAAHTFLCGRDERVPMIARFVAAQTKLPLGDDVMQLVQTVERTGAYRERNRYQSHSQLHGGADWRRTGTAHQRSSRTRHGMPRSMVVRRPVKSGPADG